MSLSVSDAQRVVRFATTTLQEKPGSTLQRLAKAAGSELGIADIAGIRDALRAAWDGINEKAGLGALQVVHAAPRVGGFQRIPIDGTAAGARLPAHKTAAAVLSSQEMKAAGTVNARIKDEKGTEFHVHGPQYWDLPTTIGWQDRPLFRKTTSLLLRSTWPIDHGEKKFRGVSGAEIEALTKPGPQGEPPALRPGDFLMNGGGGDPSHAALFVGNDKHGHPMIIHAMATNNEGRSRLEWLGDAVKLPFTASKTGVLYERVGDFFDRYHRDTVVICRLPDLAPEKIARGLERAHKLIGADYDYKLAPGVPKDANDANGHAVYCTEVVAAFVEAAVGKEHRDQLPYFGTSFREGGSPLHATFGLSNFVLEPSHVLQSKDVEIGAMLGRGAAALEEVRRTHVPAPSGRPPA